MSAIDYCICIEELARVDPSVALSVAAHNGLVLRRTSSCSAPKQQKQRFLRRSRAARRSARGG